MKAITAMLALGARSVQAKPSYTTVNTSPILCSSQGYCSNACFDVARNYVEVSSLDLHTEKLTCLVQDDCRAIYIGADSKQPNLDSCQDIRFVKSKRGRGLV